MDDVTQLLADFTLGARTWRTVFVATKDTAPTGTRCSHPTCTIATDRAKARIEPLPYRVGFVKLTKILSLDDGPHPELHEPEAIEVKRHLHSVLNNGARPVYLCGECYPHRLPDLLNKPQ